VKKDDYVKIVAVNNDYRHGYVSEIHDGGFILIISLFEEGESKIAFDTERKDLLGIPTIDYVSILTETEKRIVPMLSAGYNTSDIAGEMSISPTTVRAHLRTLRIKLHLDDRAQLIAFSQALEALIIKQAGVDR